MVSLEGICLSLNFCSIVVLLTVSRSCSVSNEGKGRRGGGEKASRIQIGERESKACKDMIDSA